MVIPSIGEDDGSRGPVVTGVRTICTAPEGLTMVVVRVDTDVPGLYGLGCATFAQRARAVVTVVDEYLAPFLIGRRAAGIEDIWHAARATSYWRDGPVLNNALAGVDQALWDIKGKLAGMPLHELWGGRVRDYAMSYAHIRPGTLDAVVRDAAARVDEGFRAVRVQPPAPGRLDLDPPAWDETRFLREVATSMREVRDAVGPDVGLIHDVHERLAPAEALRLLDAVAGVAPYFVEDPLAPEDLGWLPWLRERSSVPLAMGEMFVTPHEYVPPVARRWIDFLRVHVSFVGGLTAALKIAALCEMFGVRTVWHGPGDMSPVGHAAQLHLDMSSMSFGIREAHLYSDAAREVFPGTPHPVGGRFYASDVPGIGIDLDERKAAAYPPVAHPLGGGWPVVRRTDGSVVRP